MNYFTNRGSFGYSIIELFGCSLKKTTQDPEFWLLFSRATIFVHHMFPARVPSGLLQFQVEESTSETSMANLLGPGVKHVSVSPDFEGRKEYDKIK